MSDLKKNIEEKIKHNRPNLSISSVRTYVSILFNLNKKMDGKKDIEWFSKEHEEIMKYLEQTNDQTKKTTLSSLFVLTDLKEYQTVMSIIMKKVNDQYKNQTMNEKQKENWISVQEIKDKYNLLLTDAKLMLDKKKLLNEKIIMEFFV